MMTSPLFSLGFILAEVQPSLPYFSIHLYLDLMAYRLSDDFHILRIWRTILQDFFFFCHTIQDLEWTLGMIKQIHTEHSHPVSSKKIGS